MLHISRSRRHSRQPECIGSCRSRTERGGVRDVLLLMRADSAGGGRLASLHAEAPACGHSADEPERTATGECPRRTRHGGAGAAGSCGVWGAAALSMLAFTAVGVGLRRLIARGRVATWDGGQGSMLWMSVAAAVASSVPGLLCLGCGHAASRRPRQADGGPV